MSPTFDEIDKSDSFTLYADTLDDPSAFHPTSSQKAARPPGFKVFDRMPASG